MSRMSSESWKASRPSRRTPSAPPPPRGWRRRSARRSGRRWRSGTPVLPATHVEVVLQRVVVGTGPQRLEDLALDQPGEGLRLDPDGVGAELGGELRGLRRRGSRRSGSRRGCPTGRWPTRPRGAGRPRPSRRRGRARRGGSARPRRPRSTHLVGLAARARSRRRAAPAAGGTACRRPHQVAGRLGDERRLAATCRARAGLDSSSRSARRRASASSGTGIARPERVRASSGVGHRMNCSRNPRQVEHRPGDDAQDQRGRPPRSRSRSAVSTEGWRDVGAVGLGLAEEHHHDDPHVEERRGRAGEHADDHHRPRARRPARPRRRPTCR